MGREARQRKDKTDGPSPGSPRLGTIAGEWLNYARLIVPKDAPPVQLTESRRAFYAGAASMFKLVSGISDSVPDTEDGYDQGAEEMEKLNQELGQFLAAIKSGRA